MTSPATFVDRLIRGGSERSRKVKVNVLYSIGIKGISIGTSFILVPITLNYLGTADYGIWLTLSSVIAWFGFFDIGLGNGLRNKFTEAVSINNTDLARTYVSTTYAGLAIILGIIWIAFFLLNSFVDWNSLLRAPVGADYNLNTLALFVFTLFMIRMVLKLISVIIIADQRTALSNTFDPISNVIALIAIYILAQTTSGSLQNFVLVVTIAPIVVLGIASLIFFSSSYRKYRPSFKFIDLTQFKELASLGVKFFIIQISVLVIFSTDNLIITRILGPSEVTVYNIAYKYFSILTMGFAIIMTPMWSAYTQAYVLNDVDWIRNTNKKLIQLWLLIVTATVLMLLIAEWFYTIWVGKEIVIPFMLSLFMGLFIIISTWNNIFVYFINGTGKITLQVYSSVIMAALNIPISVFLAKGLNMGSSGVMLGTCLCLLPGVLIGPIQYSKILNKTDTGIWSK
jgi:O-antigen/teichoic acid export membrane protein